MLSEINAIGNNAKLGSRFWATATVNMSDMATSTVCAGYPQMAVWATMSKIDWDLLLI